MCADRQLETGIGVQPRRFLDIAVLTDRDVVVVAAQHAVEPDADAGRAAHRADDRCIRRDPLSAVELRNAVAEAADHADSPKTGWGGRSDERRVGNKWGRTG